MKSPPNFSEVSDELDRVLSSSTFRNAHRSAKLLRFVVEETLAGRADRLKDYTLGAEALGRGDNFDPRTDPIARVEASRLRSRLELYYATEGAGDPVVINLPKGAYVPQFEARLQKDGAAEASAVKPSGRFPLARHYLLVATVVFAALTLVFGGLLLRERTASPSQEPELRYSIQTPPTTDPLSLALAPDGSAMIFVAMSKDRPTLWWLPMNSPEEQRPLAGTEGATEPFWSPDSRSVGFFAEGLVKRIDIESGVVKPLAPAIVPAGGAWSRNGTIIFPQVPNSPLFQVPDKGGDFTPLTHFERQQNGHRAPQFLPDQHHFLYYASSIGPDSRGVYVGDLNDVTFSKQLVPDADSQAVYVSGHLLFVRQGTLFAQEFDVERLETQGEAHPIARSLALDGSSGMAALSASEDGLIAFRAGSSGKQQFVWFNRMGDILERLGAPADSGPAYVSLSPDDKRLVTQKTVDGNTDIYLQDAHQSGGPVKVTYGPETDIAPIWSPQGDRVIYASRGAAGGFDLFLRTLTPGEPELIWASNQSKQPTDWFGDLVLARSLDPETGWDIWVVPLKKTADGKDAPSQLVRTKYEERDARFSPNGKWIAYTSNELGRFEIYVQPYPGPGEKHRVSLDGGVMPTWGNENELFYIGLNGELTSVSIRLGVNGNVENSAPEPLFPSTIDSALAVARSYAVSHDGKRFLVNTMVEESVPPITVIVNGKLSK